MSDALEVMNTEKTEFRTPTRPDVWFVVAGGPWESCRTFGGTVWHLLMAGFCLTLMIGCTTPKAPPSPDLSAFQLSLRTADSEILAQTTKAVDGINENTAALSEIKSKIDSIAAQLEAAQVSSQSSTGKEVIQSEDTSPDNIANDSQPVTRSVAESGDVPYWESGEYYLHMWTASWCQPCQTMKQHVKAMAAKYGLKLDIKDIDKVDRETKQAGGIDSIPQLWLCKNGKEVTRLVAGQTRKEIDEWLDKYCDPVEFPQTAVESPMPVQSPLPMTHQDMVSLHNDLHGGGSWTWPGDLETHLRQSHGVNITGGQPVGAIFPYRADGAITSQRTSLRSVSRGPFVNWRTRSVSRKSCPTGNCPIR